jgi:enamine deaminase RidA (YjgF/YER057c/UK114 family)
MSTQPVARKEKIDDGGGLHPIPWPYSHGWKVGNMLFIAGQVALDEELRIVGPGDAEAQARQVWRNIQTVCEKAGGSVSDVVRVSTSPRKHRGRRGLPSRAARVLPGRRLPGRDDVRGRKARPSRPAARNRGDRDDRLLATMNTAAKPPTLKAPRERYDHPPRESLILNSVAE